MEFVQDVPPSNHGFGLIDLPLLADCCIIFNIIITKSTSREMRESDAGCERDNGSCGVNLLGAFWSLQQNQTIDATSAC